MDEHPETPLDGWPLVLPPSAHEVLGRRDVAAEELADTAAQDLSRDAVTYRGWSIVDLVVHTGRIHRWVTEIVRTAGDRGLPVLEVSRAELDRMTGGILHQGVALQVPPFAYEPLQALALAAASRLIQANLDQEKDRQLVERYLSGGEISVELLLQRGQAQVTAVFEKPRPLVPRHRCFGIPERLAATGAVLTPLDEEAVAAADTSSAKKYWSATSVVPDRAISA